MSLSEAIDALSEQFSNQSWFHSVRVERGRPVVVVTEMNLSVLTTIPDTIGNLQVLVHFSDKQSPISHVDRYVPEYFIEEILDDSDLDLDYLPELSEDLLEDDFWDTDELKSQVKDLTSKYGKKIVRDIFYEVHDGDDNAVSEHSKDYPDVRKVMDTLYEQFGFDILYEELF